MASDRERADYLTELARQFFLWLQTNAPDGLSGLKGLTPDAFRMNVGIYRKVEPTKVAMGITTPGLIVDDLWEDPEERRRLKALGLGAQYVLFNANPNSEVFEGPTGDLVEYRVNEVHVPYDEQLDLSRPGTLTVSQPQLDSLVANADTLGTWSHITFAGIMNRADLVWDDMTEAERVGFQSRYRWIFDYDAPRPAYEQNVATIIPLDAHENLATFRNYLYWYATYENRARVAEEGGDYYKKWKAKTPLRANQREFRPTQLSNTYLRECFYEPVLKKNEAYILFDIDRTRFVYQLVMSTASAGKPPRLSVTPVLKIQSVARPERTEPKVTPPIESCIFYALDGGGSLPSQLKKRGRLELRSAASGRQAYNYKAAVRWYFGNKHIDPGDDEAWFQLFVDTLFPDSLYAVDATHERAKDSALSLDELVQLSKEADADGPIQDSIKKLLEVARATPSMRYVVKGSFYGTSEESRRQLIGVSNGYVYEWYPRTGLVTQMSLANWYDDNYIGKIAADVYESTRGMLPIIAVVTWGGVIVMTGGIVGGGPLANLARNQVQKFLKDQAVKRMTKELIKKFRTQLIAMLVDAIANMFPTTDNALIELLRGFVHGYGAGAVEHYLTSIGARAEKQVEKLKKKVINTITLGIDRAYEVYQKLTAALNKLEAVLAAIKKIWSPQLAEAAGTALIAAGMDVAIALVVSAFVLAYVDYLAKEGIVEQSKREAWGRAQRDVLKLMVKETAADLAAYADAVREDLSGSPPSAELVKERNDKLAASIVAAVMKAPTEAPNVIALFEELLHDLGIENIKELLQLGFFDLVTRGWDAMRTHHPDLVAKGARILGEALGELIGTFFLERAIMPKHWRKRSITGVRPLDKAIKKTIAGGPAPALWKFAKFPLDELRMLLKVVTDDLKHLGSDTPEVFERAQRKDTVYRDLLKSVIGEERELTASTTKLAADATLPQRLLELAAKAQTEAPPPIDEILDASKSGDVEWPRDALLFVLENWLRVGINKVLRVFENLESDVAFGGKFRLATLMEIAGLSVSLDDKLAQELAVKFAREFKSAKDFVEESD